MNSINQSWDESVTFFKGQRVEPADLEALVARQRESRWLHNRTLHSWGIASGLAVIGNKESREVVVGAGYAIDSIGREILLSEPHKEPIPPVAGENGKPARFYLTISFPSEDSIATTETREGVCLPRGAVRLLERPIFCWVKIDEQGRPEAELRSEIEEGRKIVLAQAEIINCKLAKDVSIKERRNVQPATQPYIASGRTPEKATQWLLWEEDILVDEVIVKTPIGVQFTVDTSAAGFRQVPNYMAYIEGKRFAIRQPSKNEDFIAPTLTHIEGASANQFTLRALVIWGQNPTFPPAFPPDFLKIVKEVLGWHVVWMGIEG